MTEHWIDDERKRRFFWAKMGELGLDKSDVHELLGVESVREFDGTGQACFDAIRAALDAQSTPEPEPEPEPEEEMAPETAIATVERPDAPAEWREREEVDALARRLQKMLPGQRLSREESLLLAQYASAMDANPFRGEVYAFESHGKLVLTEGYKLLVRWARRQCNFSERYEELSEAELPEDAIGFRCRILRDDAKDTLQTLVEAGAPWDEALEIASQEAVGVVTKADRWSERRNRPIDPPVGWTWEDVARKRALKNALNRAYGAPSPREIARETWMVGGTETCAEDWIQAIEELPEIASTTERERLAEMHARERKREPDDRPPEETLKENITLLRGEQADLL